MIEDQSNPFGLVWDEEQIYLRSLLVGVTWNHIWRDCDRNWRHKRRGECFSLRVGSFLGFPAMCLVAHGKYVVLQKRKPDDHSWSRNSTFYAHVTAGWYQHKQHTAGATYFLFLGVPSDRTVLGVYCAAEPSLKEYAHGLERVGGPQHQ